MRINSTLQIPVKGLRSPVNRIGGKHFLRHWIAEKIPAHKVFVEVFAGSCVISLTKKPSETTIINDIDSSLINFWKILQHPERRGRLINLLDNMLYSRVVWQELRSNWKRGITPDDTVKKASEWFYLNRSTYASDMQYGGFMSASKGCNPAQSFRGAVSILNEVGEAMKGFIIENLNYKTCIERFDSEEAVLYVDCPYFSHEGYYGNSFSEQDHYHLAELLHSVKAKVMVSHYQCDIYNQLYFDWNKYEFRSFKGSSKAVLGAEKPRTTEVLYCNFAPENSLFSELVGVGL